jgi:hypothetical protein
MVLGGPKHNLGNRVARVFFALQRDRVFEIEDHGVGFGGEGLLHLARVVAGDVEVAADGGRVGDLHTTPFSASSRSSTSPMPSSL